MSADRHDCYFASCGACDALFCTTCGGPWLRPLSEATFTVAVVPHEQHVPPRSTLWQPLGSEGTVFGQQHINWLLRRG